MDSGENFKGLLKHAKRNGVLWLIVIGLAAGILLFVFGGIGKSDSDRKDDDTVITGDVEEYRRMLEDRIVGIVKQVRGAGNVSASVTLTGGFEYVYAQNVTERNGYESREYIVIGSGNSESVVCLRMKAPEISGVGVVCDGGDDPCVRSEIIGLLSASCGIGTNKIYVASRAP